MNVLFEMKKLGISHFVAIMYGSNYKCIFEDRGECL